jgi:lipopolysaccharide exporter
MSLSRRAVIAAAWQVGAGMGGRLVGVIGTFVLTRFLAPEIAGEVGIASVLVLSARQLTNICVGQYIVARPAAGGAVVFQASQLHLGLAILSAIGVIALAAPLAPLFDAPHIASYVPGLALAMLIGAVADIPQRILIRDLRFRAVGLGGAVSETLYAVSSVALAAAGWGGAAIVWANVLQSAFKLLVFAAAVDRREWLVPSRLRRETVRDVVRFGAPLQVAGMAALASDKWDNLIIAGAFGPAAAGVYNLGYNLANIPSDNVGEAAVDVLMPSFAQLEVERRKEGFVRASALLAMIVFPLGIGLGAISDTLIATLFSAEWQGIAPLLTILCAMSVVHPLANTAQSYLKTRDMTGAVMRIQVIQMVALLALVGALSQVSVEWACVGVGLGGALRAALSLFAVHRADGVPMAPVVAGMLRPLLACGFMVAAVLAVRLGLERAGLGAGVLRLAAEIVAGAVAYVAAALAVAPTQSRAFVTVLRTSFARRRAAGEAR